MKKFLTVVMMLGLVQSCGSSESSSSATSNILQGDGWDVTGSPYMLPPGSTISVCNTDKTAVSSYVLDAVRLWLDAGGRDERIRVIEGCKATRVIHLNKLTQDVDFYGRAFPISGNVHNIDVPSQWAGHWTANHEIGHVFGFAHIFNGVISIMNSDDNGKYMNGGYLSDYDYSEIKRMLNQSSFKAVNALWAKKPVAVRPLSAPTPVRKGKSCLGADEVTIYADKTVTTYQGSTFTCDDGLWIRG
ncbi:MAG: hypothetical protein EOP10_04985 [Proteobacteria bacterium]|nr:MAG: hypothetical protein EOP10_04985 [Pseudomonadota bacterium]